MVKNIRETILLLVLFVLVIVVLQFTNNYHQSPDEKVSIPSSCTMLIRFNQKQAIQKYIISELYSPKANASLKSLYELSKRNPQELNKSPFTEFFENIGDPSRSLEILNLKVNNKNILLLRCYSTYKTRNEFLFSSNHNHLYIQLNEFNTKRNDLVDAINKVKVIEAPKKSDSDVQIYQVEKQKLHLSGQINTSDQSITFEIPNRNKTEITNEIQPAGLHLLLSNNNKLLNFVTKNTAEHNLKTLSVNYFGLNTYDNPIVFPNTDILMEFESDITINSFIKIVEANFTDFNVHIERDTEDSGSLFIDSVEFSYQYINARSIFLSTNNRILNLRKTTKPIILSGDLSQLLRFNDNGWKGMFATEIISNVPILNELKNMFQNTNPVITDYNQEKTIIKVKLANNQSVYGHLISILTSL